MPFGADLQASGVAFGHRKWIKSETLGLRLVQACLASGLSLEPPHAEGSISPSLCI